MKYLDLQGIKDAFANHMMKYRGYSAEEAKIAVCDFPDPYDLPYLYEDYLGKEIIDGIEYEKNASYTCFWRCRITGVPMFRFYTYYALEDIPHRQVGEYRNARKVFQVEDIDESDFPSEKDMAEEASRTFFF